jgi:hypothetical protein
MSIVLVGSTSGSITLQEPAVAGTTTLTLPATTGNVVVDVATQTLTNKTLTSPTITGAVLSSMASSVITSGTAVASTSGTSIDFTSIPSWVKRVTVMFNGVSVSGTSNPQVQIGAGSVLTTGYLSYATVTDTGSAANASSTGFLIFSNVAAANIYGVMTLVLISGNTWLTSGSVAMGTSARTSTFGGNVTLGGTLDRVRITTVNGTDTFDAGSINILYE